MFSISDLPSAVNGVQFEQPVLFAPCEQRPPDFRYFLRDLVTHKADNSAAVSGGDIYIADFKQTRNIELPDELSQAFEFVSTQQPLSPSVDWRTHLFDAASDADVDTISETIDGLFDALARDGADSIDLTGVSPEAIQAEHLAAILRATYSWRDQVPGWTHAISVAVIALERNGIDANEALTGLL